MKPNQFKKPFRDQSEQLHQLKAILGDGRYDYHKVLHRIQQVQKGDAGEKELAYYLSRMYEGLTCLHDIKLRQNDKHTSQYDFIALHSNGVLILESKCLSGQVVVRSDGSLRVTSRSGNVYCLPGLTQAIVQADTLRHQLLSAGLLVDAARVKPLVVLTDLDVEVIYESDHRRKDVLKLTELHEKGLQRFF